MQRIIIGSFCVRYVFYVMYVVYVGRNYSLLNYTQLTTHYDVLSL